MSGETPDMDERTDSGCPYTYYAENMILFINNSLSPMAGVSPDILTMQHKIFQSHSNLKIK